jgi:hypothetical protein
MFVSSRKGRHFGARPTNLKNQEDALLFRKIGRQSISGSSRTKRMVHSVEIASSLPHR